MRPERVAIFIGNSIFGDDRIGLLVGETLRSRLESSGFDVYVIERTGFALLDCLEGYGSAVVVDSICDAKTPIGKVRSFSVRDFGSVKPATPHYSGVPEAVKLMQDLQMHVPDISVIGINVRNPYALSDGIADDLSSMRDMITAEVYAWIMACDGRSDNQKMCVGFPARVIRVSGADAYVDAGDGRVKKAGIATPEAIRRGDYVLLYANLIMNKIDRRSALESVRMMKEMATRVAEEDGITAREASRPFDQRLKGLSVRTLPSSIES